MKNRIFMVLLCIGLLLLICSCKDQNEYTIEYTEETWYSLQEYTDFPGFDGYIIPDQESAVQMATAVFESIQDDYYSEFREEGYLPGLVEYNEKGRFWVVHFVPRDVAYGDSPWGHSVQIAIRRGNGKVIKITDALGE